MCFGLINILFLSFLFFSLFFSQNPIATGKWASAIFKGWLNYILGQQKKKMKSRFSCSSKDKTKIESGDFALVSLIATGKSIWKHFSVVMEYEEKTNQVLLKYIHPSMQCLVWLANDDKSWEHMPVILKKMKPPNLLNNRVNLPLDYYAYVCICFGMNVPILYNQYECAF